MGQDELESTPTEHPVIVGGVPEYPDLLCDDDTEGGRHMQIMDEGDRIYKETITHILIVLAIALGFSLLMFGAEYIRWNPLW